MQIHIGEAENSGSIMHWAWRICVLLVILTMTGCASMPKGFDQPVSVALEQTRDTRLAQDYQTLINAHPGQSGLLPLPKGLDALAARGTLARMAQKSIDAQYYLLHRDLTGMLFLNELVQAADRGVRVRLLVDDMGLWDRVKGAAALALHPQVEVRIFNPFIRGGFRMPQMIYRFGSVTRRMHNKAFIVDNQAAILGGRNIGNEYFEADPKIEFGDLDVLTVGPVVKEVSVSFDKYWNSELAFPAKVMLRKSLAPDSLMHQREELRDFIQAHNGSEYISALGSSPLIRQLHGGRVPFIWGKAMAVYDEPEKILHARDRTDMHLLRQLSPLFDSIKEDLIIFSPYFVPGKNGVKYLASLCKQGIRVRVLTNSLASTDVAIVHAGYSRYRKALLESGVELYELDKKISRKEKKDKKGKFGASKASLHTKSFVMDRRRVFIGSLNMDPRSVVENTEIGVVLESREIGQGLSEWFDTHVDTIAFELKLRKNENGPDQIRWYKREDGKETVHIRDPHTSLLKRLGVGFLGLLPIESQL